MFKPTIVRRGNRKKQLPNILLLCLLYFLFCSLLQFQKASPLEQATNKTDDHTEVLDTYVLKSETTQKNAELASLSMNAKKPLKQRSPQ
ncbi:hypothetical protein ACFTAO_18930 [Paenibacillus rhizoplanae]